MLMEFKIDTPPIQHLCSSDPILKKIINLVGNYTLVLNDDYFIKLTKSIVGQQLSLKAKDTIWTRIESICNEVTPENLLNLSDEALRSTGTSYAKISYIKGLSAKILSGQLNLHNINNYSDDEIIKILTSIKGIGRWTAEMFLIFSLGRLDILSVDDASLRRAIKWLYSFEDIPTVTEIKEIGNKWKPYRSVASLYLWSAIDTGLMAKNIKDL